MKRIGMFLLVNLLVLTTIVIATTLLGVNSYLTASGIDYLSLLIFAAIIGFSGSIISLLLSKWMAKSMMQVKVLEPQAVLITGKGNCSVWWIIWLEKRVWKGLLKWAFIHRPR